MQRHLECEQLDDLQLHGEALQGALDSLRWVNRWLGCRRVFFNAFRELEPGQHVVDLGCGGGDNLIALAKRFPSHRYLGIDGNAHTLDWARENAPADMNFQCADILSPEFELPSCDVLISSHFIYHFSEERLGHFLRRHLHRVRHKMIFNELERHSLAWWSFRLFSRALPLSPLARQDGALAIRRSYTREEWRQILSSVKKGTWTIRRRWAFRLEVQLELSSLH